MDALTCLTTRRSIHQVSDSGPSEDEFRIMLEAASRAPDHGGLRPWRLLVFRGEARRELGEVFAQSALRDDPGTSAAAVGRLRGKPLRAPLIVAVVCRSREHPKVPAWEQLASAVCAAHSISLAAHALGYGAVWRTGGLCAHEYVRKSLGVEDDEQLISWMYIGRPRRRPGPGRARSVEDRVTDWRPAEPDTPSHPRGFGRSGERAGLPEFFRRYRRKQ
ncbi:nitroreductase family protein [Streptomyces cinnamoneus]|nr:nitroreductase [Streptomyces cinnamoneus]